MKWIWYEYEVDPSLDLVVVVWFVPRENPTQNPTTGPTPNPFWSDGIVWCCGIMTASHGWRLLNTFYRYNDEVHPSPAALSSTCLSITVLLLLNGNVHRSVLGSLYPLAITLPLYITMESRGSISSMPSHGSTYWLQERQWKIQSSQLPTRWTSRTCHQ